jgi:hypothetical protein
MRGPGGELVPPQYVTSPVKQPLFDLLELVERATWVDGTNGTEMEHHALDTLGDTAVEHLTAGGAATAGRHPPGHGRRPSRSTFLPSGTSVPALLA